MNHYKWLEQNLPGFFEKLGIDYNQYCGCIVSDGDKAECYKTLFESVGLHYYHGVAIYLLTNISSYSSEVRNNNNVWVSQQNWIIENKDRFLKHLNKIKE